MTRKHFIAVARILAETEGMKNPETVRRHVTRELVAVFQEANPRFDTLRFIEAARVELD